MILLMAGIGALAMFICLYLGFAHGSFGFAYLGLFIMLIMGLFLMSEGLSIDDAIQKNSDGSYTTTYQIHTTANDPIVNLLANTFFYLPLGMILLTTFVALKR